MAISPSQTAVATKPVSDKPLRPPQLGSINSKGLFEPTQSTAPARPPSAFETFGSQSAFAVPSFSNSPSTSTTQQMMAKPMQGPSATISAPAPTAAPVAPKTAPVATPIRPPATSSTGSSFVAPVASQPRPDANGITTFADGSKLGPNNQIIPAGSAPQQNQSQTQTNNVTAPTVQPRPQTQPSQTQAQLNALRAAALQGYEMSPEERSAQERLDAIMAQQGNVAASQELGSAAISDQPIVMGLIRGQQEALQKQAAAQLRGLSAQATPLEQQLARIQQRRALEQERKKTNIGFLQSDLQSQQAASKPIEIGGNLVQLNPETGQYEAVYQGAAGGEGFTLTEGQKRFDAQGREIASGGEKQSAQPATIQEYQFAKDQGFQGSFLDYQRAKDQATSSGSSVPSSYKEWQLAGQPGSYGDWVNKSGSGNKPLSGEASKVLTIAETMIPEINLLKEAFAKDYKGSLLGITSGTNRELVKLVDQVADKVGRLRSGGAINKDEEARFKRQIASIGDIAFGSLDGANRSLDSLINEAQSVASGIRGTPSSGAVQPSGGGGDALDQALQAAGFKSDLGRSVNGPASQIAAAIKKVESGGNYNAKGGSGESGAYQFMPATWKSWAGKYLGNANAPLTPQNQDIVANARISDLLAQGYGPREISLIWNGGQPVVKKGVNSYGVAYDSGAYANKVMKALYG